MKNIVSLLFLITFCVLSSAQVPVSFNYQVIPRNGSGGVYQDQAMRLRITVFHDGLMEIASYIETFSTTTNSFGLINLQIGKGTPEPGSGSLAGLPWFDANCFLKVEIDPAGGTSYVEMGTTQLISVPYALNAKMALSSVDGVKITGDQTIAGNKTFTGTTTVPTPVNPTDAATKAYVDMLEDKVLQLQAEVGVTDIDGNHYKAVKLGNQVWMAENLKVTKFNDGTAIPLVMVNEDWAALINTPAYCWYNNNEAGYKDTYGALYNWFVASTTNICPSGWHVPTDAEWEILMNYLIANGYNYDGTTSGNKVAKALASVSGWTLSDVEGAVGNTDFPGKRNITGFSAPAGGYRYFVGIFYNIGSFGIWWSSTGYSGYDGTMAFKRQLKYDNSDVNWSLTEKMGGCSIRCLKD